MTADDIIKKYLGVPFKNKGRDLDGLDCYGLVKCIYKDFGFDLFDIDEDYDAKWTLRRKNYFLENYAREWVEVERPMFLDVVAMKNFDGAMVHLGVCIGNGKFIHTSKAGTVVCHLSVWKDKVQGYYRRK